MSSIRNFFDCDVKPPVGHKMGFCTTRFTKKTKCPNCRRLVWELHQVERYNSIDVCAFCFDKVRKTLIKFTN